MNKNEIKQKRTELVKTILDIEKLKTQKTAIVKALAADFEENESAYRSGIKTDAGLLFRKPSWNFEAKPIVEVV